VVRGPYAGRGSRTTQAALTCGDAILLRPLAEEQMGTRGTSERVAVELAVQRLDKEIAALKARMEK